MILLRFLLACVICQLLLVSPGLQGQTLSTQNKRAEKSFSTAIDSYQARNYDRALAEIRRAIEQDPLFTEAYILQGDIYADGRQFDKAIDSYQMAVTTNNPFSPNLYNVLANMQYAIGRYQDARLNYQRFLDFGPPELCGEADQRLRLCHAAGSQSGSFFTCYLGRQHQFTV
jgi:tetratricopeptide (TPR) repeat protein